MYIHSHTRIHILTVSSIDLMINLDVNCAVFCYSRSPLQCTQMHILNMGWLRLVGSFKS